MEAKAAAGPTQAPEAAIRATFVPAINIVQTEAFWISPIGEVVRAAPNHISVVNGNPEKFGLSRAELDAWFEKHGEPPGSEGRAREEVLRKLIRRGWVRIRFYVTRSFQGFSVNVGKDDRCTKCLVTDLFGKLLGQNALKYYEVRYDSPSGLKRFTVQEIAEFALFRGMEEGMRPFVHVTFLASPADLAPVSRWAR